MLACYIICFVLYCIFKGTPQELSHLITPIQTQVGEQNEKALRDQYGADAVSFMRVDITSHSNFEAAFEKCFELYGGIDVVVNNAGVDGEINWESQLQINFYVCQDSKKQTSLFQTPLP